MFALSIALACVGAGSHTSTPLRQEEKRLLSAPTAVQHYFVSEVFEIFNMTYRQFNRLPQSDRDTMTSNAYYLRSGSMLPIVYKGDSDLVEILNSVDSDTDIKCLVMTFENKYFEKFKSWPKIIPVNVDSLTDRIVSEKIVR